MIEKIENQSIRVSNKSITVFDSTGKTKNVITKIETFYSMPFNKQMEWNIKFHKYGKMPVERMFLYNNKWYFLDDNKYIPSFLSEDKYSLKVQKEAREKLENVKKFNAIIINVEQIIDKR